ncbi:Gfo/Idh/MocA family oxidoreductase [Kribbella solani]|uniref:Gfo/Idh/MocA family protein n=1 Tax=Kribbella solani TaxID=236067 RepID=UPI0029A64B89|nr:Gfo/Idh/MocA family oxidoreductase [Kribbella solani]MDX2972827.1 Gfo/Idh/MocA family oxidoreductase [Kribbella solani]MDX3007089.1 Gfo/Idh/MocA family oxidoreductase [Kribbella solani]
MTRRYAVAGTGSRAQSYVRAISERPEDARLVALLDPNPGRLAYHQRFVASLGLPAQPEYGADDLERMVKEQSVDRVVVTSPDYTHADVVSRLLRAGADVIVEKPLTIDVDGTRRIVDAMNASGKSVVVTFNYRYSPRNSALRQLIQDGEIGQVTSVEFQWVLDTRHGADYFRRWHREKKNSGGLLIHKASHHFDLVNWWIASSPQRVFASGGLAFYGADNAAARGLGERPARGTVEGSANDPWLLDLRDDDVNRQLYYESEQYDGYLRDQDVFGPGITIEDNMSVIAEYANGARLSYSLNAHSPWEGYRVSVNGTLGRAELEVVERAAVVDDQIDPSYPSGRVIAGDVRADGERLVLQKHWATAVEVEIPPGEGGHGGGDRLIYNDLFQGPGNDPLARAADVHDGVRAVAVGIAANQSLTTGQPITITDLNLGGWTT